MIDTKERIAIVGAGRLGGALATGFVVSGRCSELDVVLCRRQVERLREFGLRGHPLVPDAREAVDGADIVLIGVQPQEMDATLAALAPVLAPEQIVVTLAANVTTATVSDALGGVNPVVRAMPNIAAAMLQSMTCLSIAHDADARTEAALARVERLFGAVGSTLRLQEDLMESATALGACGIAFFLRAIRAASQGGIQIGFHPEQALLIAAQTAAGAAALAQDSDAHPEALVDDVTTPRGCTIAGLNELEHSGFSSALVRGILTAAQHAGGLYRG
jgi:pyrroline-5-carboxylate reductase